MSIYQGFARSTDRSGLTAYTEIRHYAVGEALPGKPNSGTTRNVRPNGDGSYTVETTTYSMGDGATTTEVAGYMTNEPIDTHPKFISSIGGKAGAALNDAQFDEDGVFIGFPPGSKYAGVTSYLCFGSSKTETRVSQDTGGVDTSAIGKLSGSWLVTGINVETRGPVVTVRKEMRKSGSRGWDTTIYSSS